MSKLFLFAVFLGLFFLIRSAWFWFWRSGWKRLAAWLIGPVAVRTAPPAERRGTLKRDPVCGTHVDTELAARSEHGGQVYYFCSDTCRDKYRQSMKEAS